MQHEDLAISKVDLSPAKAGLELPVYVICGTGDYVV
jgi:hypothetical protein